MHFFVVVFFKQFSEQFKLSGAWSTLWLQLASESVSWTSFKTSYTFWENLPSIDQTSLGWGRLLLRRDTGWNYWGGDISRATWRQTNSLTLCLALARAISLPSMNVKFWHIFKKTNKMDGCTVMASFPQYCCGHTGWMVIENAIRWCLPWFH